MKRIGITVLLLSAIFLWGCSPLEQQAYQAVVSANAFLKSMKAQHPECSTPQVNNEVCTYLSQATAAKDSLIDAVEVYCAGPDFAGGGKCDPPAKGTPAYAQAAAKVQAAMAGYKQLETDLKNAAGGKL
jgi:hypothetical protein